MTNGEKIIFSFLAKDGYDWSITDIADELTILFNIIMNSAERKGHQFSMRKQDPREDNDGKVIEPQKAVITITVGEVEEDELNALLELYTIFIKDQVDLLEKVRYIAGEYVPKPKKQSSTKLEQHE